MKLHTSIKPELTGMAEAAILDGALTNAVTVDNRTYLVGELQIDAESGTIIGLSVDREALFTFALPDFNENLHKGNTITLKGILIGIGIDYD